MKKLLLKSKRDIFRSLGQFISIVMVLAIGVAFFCGMLVAISGLEKSVDKFYNDNNLADIWSTWSKVDDNTLNTVRNIEGVDEAQSRLMMPAYYQVDGEIKEYMVFTIPDNSKINTLHYAIGKAPENFNEIVVTKPYFDENKLELGSKLTFSLGGQIYDFKITGAFYSPEYIYIVKDAATMIPDNKNFGILFSHQSFLQRSNQDANQIIIKGTNLDFIESQLKSLNGYGYSHQKIDLLSYQMTNSEIEGVKSVSYVLPMLFFIVSTILIFVQMTRTISSERNQIGIMKALGLSKNKIFLHYLTYALIVSIIGNIIGSMLGILVITNLMNSTYSAYFYMPSSNISSNLVYPVIALIVTTLFSALAVYLSCRKQLQETSSALLRPIPPKSVKLRGKESKFKLSFKNKIIFRNLLSNKKRTMLSSAGIIAGCGLIFAVVGLKFSLDNIINFEFNEVPNYNYQVITNQNISFQQVITFNDDKLNNQIEITKFATLSSQIILPEEEYSTLLNVLPSEQTAINFYNSKGDKIDFGSNELIITEKMANEQNIKIGDVITLRILYDKNVEVVDLRVSQIARTYLSQGLFISYQSLEEKLINPTINGFYAKIINGANSQEIMQILINENIVEIIYDRQEINKAIEESLSMFNYIIVLMIVASAILSFAVIINVTSINIFERRRDIATLKVLGYQKREVEKLILTENFIITAFASIFGIALGILLHYSLLKTTLPDDIMIPFSVSFLSFPISLLSIFIFTLFANLTLKRKVAKINMVESLKSIE